MGSSDNSTSQLVQAMAGFGALMPFWRGLFAALSKQQRQARRPHAEGPIFVNLDAS
jgi:hypothetical protein